MSGKKWEEEVGNNNAKYQKLKQQCNQFELKGHNPMRKFYITKSI